MFRGILLALLLLPAQDDNDGVAARINNEFITWKDVDDRLKLPPQQITPEMRLGKLRQMVEELLFLQAAKKHQIAVSDREIEPYVRRDMRRYADEETFEAWLRTKQMTRTEHREEWRRSVLVQKLQYYLNLKAKVAPGVDTPSISLNSVSPEEIRRYYRDHREEFRGREHVTVWRIAFQFKTPAERKEKLILAESILRRLKEGADFFITANLYSDVYRTLKDGMRFYGDRELRREDSFYSEETNALLFDRLKEGEISDIVEDGSTFNIFSLRKRVKQEQESFEEAQGRIRTMLESQKRVRSRRALRDELLKRAHVEPGDLFKSE